MRVVVALITLAMVSLANGCGGQAHRGPGAPNAGQRSPSKVPITLDRAGRPDTRVGYRTEDGGEIFPAPAVRAFTVRRGNRCVVRHLDRAGSHDHARVVSVGRAALDATRAPRGVLFHYAWSKAVWSDCRPDSAQLIAESSKNPTLRLSTTVTIAHRLGTTELRVPPELLNQLDIARVVGLDADGSAGVQSSVRVR